MGVTFSQSFPQKPTLTDANLPSQKGKIYIVTGGASGVGFELCAILYQACGKVYLAGWSEANAKCPISKVRTLSPSSPGELVFLSLSLDDLTTIKAAVEAFTATESKPDVLFNNAGVSLPPLGSVSAQGQELQMAANCLDHYLLTQLLLPTLLHTAESVSWTSSIVVDLSAATCRFNISAPTDPPPDQ